MLTPLPSKISFQEPNIQHQDDAITDPELAKKLEKKYHILKLFSQRKKKQIKGVIIKETLRAWKSRASQDQAFGRMGVKITSLYRNFMLANGTGIKTRSAVREHRQSFIATGEYYEKMKAVVS